MDNNYDLGIIGGGPAGYSCAFYASSLGKKVILFEKENIGGVCLNKGCIPTKSILKSSEVYSQMKNCEKFGLNAENISVDYKKVIERKNEIVEKLKKNLELALKNAKINIIKSQAEIIDSNHIKDIQSGEIYNCSKIICATGAKPRQIKGLEFDHKFLLSSDDILNLEVLPKSVVIIGSGAIGIEWAQIFNNFGVETTVIEVAQNLLPNADIDISKRIERIFKLRKIRFFTKTTVEKIENNILKLSNGEEIFAQIVLVAGGRIPNVEEKIDGVSYIGDSAGEIQLAHFAIKQALENISSVPFRKDLVPAVVYGEPEIAWVGVKEQDLSGQEYQKSTVLVSSLGKAWCDGKTEGFIKILSQNDKIIGAHIVCAEASSLLGQIVIAIQNEIPVKKLTEVCFPHPTYSEGIFDAVLKI